MSRITSSVGLITGIPIEETVNKLLAVAARPRNLVSKRNSSLGNEKLAVQRLSSLVLALRFEASKLGDKSLFSSKSISSSDTAALTATIASGANPAVANYLFTPVQTASAQQYLSQSFASTATVGEGSFTFRIGGFVDQDISLSELNGGAGVRRGSIRITDRSGATAVVDLSYARTVDDVLKSINDNSTLNVTAVAVGDRFKLIDNTGGSGNLTVQNVGSGLTATDLGLAGINVAAATATGSDVFTLHANTALKSLNDGNGVQLKSGNDLAITFKDGSTLDVDLGDSDTLGEVLEALNAADPGRVSAAISADGNRIDLTDLTTGVATFAVANVGTGTAASDLGLSQVADDDAISGRRLVSGLRDTLVSSLKGGQGLDTLGEIDITNRDGVLSTVDLNGAETLGEIIGAINDQAVGVTAAVNAARNGIVLTDTTGATSSNLIIANGDANNSATVLGIVADVADSSVNSGPLNRQTVSAATLLSSLNGGVGVKANDIKFTDSAGNVGAVDLNPAGDVAKTLGDVIDRINALTIGVEARINDTGDGLVLIDTAGGTGTLKVEDVGNTTTAKELRILGTAVTKQIGGEPKQVIDGTSVVTVTIGADDKLADVVKTINGLGRGVTASLLNDGTGQRLSLAVDKTGVANAVLLDASGTALQFEEINSARDALVLYGTASSGSGILIHSSTNDFANVVDGVNLTINDGSNKPVTVHVNTTNTTLTTRVSEFVNAYNSLRGTLGELTVFDAESLTTGILFGTREALRVDSELTRLVTSPYFGVGSITSLEAIGISLDDKGNMSLDKDKLAAALAANPASVEKLFTDETRGVSAKLNKAIDQLAGNDGAALDLRTETLDDIIKSNTNRIASMDERLARQREILLTEFARLESTIATMQQSLSALSSLQIIPPITSTRGN
ncbi:MAG: flagellar filament capping protein FliD [Pirellulales bacterium]